MSETNATDAQRPIWDLADPDSPRVVEALTRRCDLCKAAVGDLCTNVITPGAPLPGRVIHLGRLSPP